jgi:retron-type reverse transcriptase
MWWNLEEAILEASRIKIRNYERYRKRAFDENRRRIRRSSGIPVPLSADRPALWELDPALDPFHVRAKAKSISHAVSRSLQTGRYAPLRPAGFRVAKRGEGTRLVSSFAIADEVISSRLYRSLLRKNRARLSARSYAYRDDIGVYDAIMHIQSEWREEHRLFVAEYDFTEFFDSISHAHIWRTIDSLGLTLTELEKSLIQAFLTAPLPYTNLADKSKAAEPRTKGVPQGTSISLLLANIAASPLDRALERLGVGFVRYADDTMIWSRDYAAICRAVEELHAISSQLKSPINQEKSKGVRLLVSPDTKRAEFPFTAEVEYLSHAVGLRSVRMKDDSEREIRQHISAILFNNLLREPLKGTQDPTRLGAVDKDYIAYIWQLRRYLYGNLNESEVRRLGRGPLPPISLRGAMSRFPLTDDDQSLRELDRWIATQTWLALRKRSALLAPLVAFWAKPQPWDLPREGLTTFTAASARTGKPLDLRLPSALRMTTVVRKAVRTHGTSVVGRGSALYGNP